jgi:glutathione S-transferase
VVLLVVQPVLLDHSVCTTTAATALPIMSLSSLPARLTADTTIKISYNGEDGLEMPKYIIGYWSIRGLAAPIRMLLSAAQVNHWVTLYDVLEEGETGWIRPTWTTDKAWMKEEGNAFMNLPHLVDCIATDGGGASGASGDDCLIINQSNAILTHLGRELHFLGSNKVEQAKCEELLGELMDLRNHMVRFAYASSCGSDKWDAQKLLDTCSAIWDKLELHLTQTKSKKTKTTTTTTTPTTTTTTYLVGTKLSAPDFHLWEMLDQFLGLCEYYSLPSVTVHRPLLGRFHTTFVTLPENEAYFTSTSGGGVLYSSLPYNNPYARFGSNPLSSSRLIASDDDEQQQQAPPPPPPPPKRFGPYMRGQARPWIQKGTINESRTKA